MVGGGGGASNDGSKVERAGQEGCPNCLLRRKWTAGLRLIEQAARNRGVKLRQRDALQTLKFLFKTVFVNRILRY